MTRVQLTVPLLREALEARGLDSSGLKAALVARLQHSLAGAGGPATAEQLPP